MVGGEQELLGGPPSLRAEPAEEGAAATGMRPAKRHKGVAVVDISPPVSPLEPAGRQLATQPVVPLRTPKHAAIAKMESKLDLLHPRLSCAMRTQRMARCLSGVHG